MLLLPVGVETRPPFLGRAHVQYDLGVTRHVFPQSGQPEDQHHAQRGGRFNPVLHSELDTYGRVWLTDTPPLPRTPQSCGA
jgi:hypothetical protein